MQHISPAEKAGEAIGDATSDAADATEGAANAAQKTRVLNQKGATI